MSSVIHNNFCYTHYPRTGGTFIAKWLSKCFKGEETNQGMTPLKEMPKREKMWGVIRNPFDFYTSLYHFDQSDMTFEEWLRNLLNGKINWYWTDANKLKEMGLATYSYIYFFCDENRKLIATDIIKYEPNLADNIEKFFDTFMPLTKKQKELLRTMEKQRVSEVPPEDRRKYWNKKLINLIKEKDKFIFNLYPEYERHSD